MKPYGNWDILHINWLAGFLPSTGRTSNGSRLDTKSLAAAWNQQLRSLLVAQLNLSWF